MRTITIHKATHLISQNSQTIVEIQVNNDSDQPKRSYLIETQKKIGSGQTSNVYHAYRLLEKGKPDRTNPLVAKVFLKPEFFKEQEWIIQAKYYDHIDTCYVSEGVNENQVYYGFSKLLPEKTLLEYLKDRNKKRLEDPQKFDILKSLKIARAIAKWVKLMHHRTTENGEVTLHLDLKPENIIIDFDHKGEPCIHIIDFGNAQTLLSDNPTHKIQVAPSGSPGYVAPEVAKGEPVGLKSDIYSLTPILMMVLGATNPIKDKQEARTQLIGSGSVPADDRFTQEREISDIPFNAKFLMLSHKCIKKPCDTEQLTMAFFERMQHVDYDFRPDSDELFAFIDTLTELYQAYEHPTGLTTYKFSLFAKLILMKHGFWDVTYDDLIGKTPLTKHQELLCKTIFDLESANLLSRELIQLLSKKESKNIFIMSIIVLLSELKLLNESNLTLICLHIDCTRLLCQLEQNSWKIDEPLILRIFNQKHYASVLLPISKFTTQSFFEKTIDRSTFLQKLQELEQEKITINKICIYSTWLMNLNEEKEQLAFMQSMQRLDAHAICRYIKTAYARDSSTNSLLKKINQNQFVSDFITEYKKTYQNTFFKNPNSKMWKKIKNNEVHTPQDILTHQKNNRGSRTDKIIQKYFSHQLTENP